MSNIKWLIKEKIVSLQKNKNKKTLYIIIAATLVNFCIFLFAFPDAFKLPADATFARDFSAYYIGEWRLFNNPTQVYYGGGLPTDYPIYPMVQSFKYTPSFLVMFAPFVLLSYENALAAFDLLTVALIPALAFFVYKLVKDKNIILAAAVAIIVLINPLPAIQINNTISYAAGYYFGYLLGNAHILQAILLVGALYFGFAKKPWLSALLFTFGAFDPRPALFALPLLLWYNRGELAKFVSGTAGLVVLTNLPFFFYYGVGFAFLREIGQAHIVSQWYPYDWVPIYAVLALTIMEVITTLNKKYPNLKTQLRV
ncbi:MAG: glycosyltransferase 87 family protein [Candidatus Bathyarchaeota archaeon]|nr:glycosyltransferase 87 family protein [Candidatus Bathyarchaeota archaeon]